METIMKEIESTLASFEPISLSQMSGIKLMNRIDTKYMIDVRLLPKLLEKAKEDYFAQEIDGSRMAYYRTLYFDTENAEMFTIHHNGRRTRQKLRIREYVESNQRFLEVKNKNNKGRTKKVRISVPDENVLAQDEARSFIEEKLNYGIERLSPRLRNYFYRVTLVNKAKTERLTIDVNIKFRNCKTDLQNTFEHLCIVEVKQDGNMHSPFKDYLQCERVKRKGISKYCLGMVLTDNSLKRNRFKRKINYIKKMLKVA